MKKEVVPFDIAVQLRDLGFKCDYHFVEYDTEGNIQQKGLLSSHNLEFIIAPLWQQAFDFFREKHLLHSCVGFNQLKGEENEIEIFDYKINKQWSVGEGYPSFGYNHIKYKANFLSYEEARLACLKQLIETCKTEEK